MQNKAVWEKRQNLEGEDERRRATEAEKDKKEGGEWAKQLAYFYAHSNVWNVFGGRSRWNTLARSAGSSGEGGVNRQLFDRAGQMLIRSCCLRCRGPPELQDRIAQMALCSEFGTNEQTDMQESEGEGLWLGRGGEGGVKGVLLLQVEAEEDDEGSLVPGDVMRTSLLTFPLHCSPSLTNGLEQRHQGRWWGEGRGRANTCD